MLVSVVIPCFNAESTIAEALETIPSTSNALPLEVILVDDGSSDQSVHVAKQKRPDLVVLSQANQGVSKARNKGISAAKGKWIQFLDADDYLIEGTLFSKVIYALETNADALVSDWLEFRSWPQKSKALHHLTFKSSAEETRRNADWSKIVKCGPEIACSTSFWAPPAAVLYKKSIVEKVGGFREDFPIIQDARFLFDAAFFGAHLVHWPYIGAGYRVSQGSLSRRDPTGFWLDCLRNGDQIEKLWCERDGALSIAQTSALHEIFSHAANGLLKAGHPAAFTAADALRLHHGTLSRDLRCGLWLLRLTGHSFTRSIFTLKSMPKALARWLS